MPRLQLSLSQHVMTQPLKLTPSMARFAEEQVQAGNFKSVDDVARAAFALLRENSKRGERVRDELGALFAEMDEGKAIPTTDDGFARLIHEKVAKYSDR